MKVAVRTGDYTVGAFNVGIRYAGNPGISTGRTDDTDDADLNASALRAGADADTDEGAVTRSGRKAGVQAAMKDDAKTDAEKTTVKKAATDSDDNDIDTDTDTKASDTKDKGGNEGNGGDE